MIIVSILQLHKHMIDLFMHCASILQMMRNLAEQEENMGLKTFLVGLSGDERPGRGNEDDGHVDEQGLDYANDGTR